MFIVNLTSFRKHLKLGVKIILLAFILCYILPKLLMLFLNFESQRNIPGQELPEKPLRVFLKIIPTPSNSAFTPCFVKIS